MSSLNILLTLAQYFADRDPITLHPERCLNSRFRATNCSRCADSCPADQAITVTKGKPSFNAAACLHCGLCLHQCPTEAFTWPDTLPAKLVKTVAAIPASPLDLVCPQHPHPEHGAAPQAIQVTRCLAVLSPATLLEISTQKPDLWLDDTPCHHCPLGQVHPTIQQTVTQANAWAKLLGLGGTISLRTEMVETPPLIKRPVYNAYHPPMSRRGLFSSFKPSEVELPPPTEKIELVKRGKSVPVSARLPQFIPSQRTQIITLFEKSPSTHDEPLPLPHLPLFNLQIDSNRCTACTLCAKFCPTGALKYLSNEEMFALTFEPALCLGADCNICTLACPEKAVSPTQPTMMSPPSFTQTHLATRGELTPCQRCKQPIAKGSQLPKQCFACRPPWTKHHSAS